MVKLRRGQRWAILVLWAVVFVFVFVTSQLVTIAPVSMLWAVGDDVQFPEREFRVAAFPRGDAAVLYDHEERPYGYLNRAIFISLDEWKSDGPIGVFTSATDVMFVDRADLTLEPEDESRTGSLVDGARAFYLEVFDSRLDAVRRFDYFVRIPDQRVVNAHMANGDIYTSEYRVERESVVVPLKVWLTSASAPQDISPPRALLHAAVFASVTVVVAWLAIALRHWWFSPRPPEAAA